MAPHSVSIFGFHEKWRPDTWKPFLSKFTIWKQYCKILGSSRVMALWRWYADFWFLYKKCWRQQKHANLETSWYNFLKALMVHYHCTKFQVSSISLSRDIVRGHNWPPGLTLTLSPVLIGLNSRLSAVQCLQLNQPSVYGLFYRSWNIKWPNSSYSFL